MIVYVLIICLAAASCPTYSCISDNAPILQEGECAQFSFNPLNRELDRYMFNKTLCPEGFRCPYELLNSSYKSVNCTLSLRNETESMANIIYLSFGIRHEKLLPGESC